MTDSMIGGLLIGGVLIILALVIADLYRKITGLVGFMGERDRLDVDLHRALMDKLVNMDEQILSVFHLLLFVKFKDDEHQKKYEAVIGRKLEELKKQNDRRKKE